MSVIFALLSGLLNNKQCVLTQLHSSFLYGVRLALGPVVNSEKGLKLEELIDATVDELYGIPGELARQYK